MVGTIAEAIEVEPDNDRGQAQTLGTKPVVVNGRLEQNADVDVFGVPLLAGQTLVADLEAHRYRGTPLDGILQILSPQGFVLSENDDGRELDPRLTYTASHDGVVLVRVFAFPAEPNQTIALSSSERYVYRLTLTTGAFLDYCFPLAASCEQPSQLELHGYNLGPTTRTVSIKALPGQESHVVFDPLLAGIALVDTPAAAAPVENEFRDAGYPQAVPLPSIVSGTISTPRERDVYAVELSAKQQVLIRVESSRLGFPLEPVLVIASATDGKPVFTQQPEGPRRDLEGTFDAPTAGIYNISLTDLMRQGSPDHRYRMQITATADFTVDLPDSEYTVAAGAVQELVVDIDRRLKFSDEIEISLEEIPPGVICPPVRSESKQVKLMLTAGPTPFQGVLTIKGRSTAEPSLERIATVKPSPDKPFSGKTWLTVTAPAP